MTRCQSVLRAVTCQGRARRRGTEGSRTRQQTLQHVFSLPASDNESKTNIVKVIRSILRENFRRHIKCELPLEKTCKDRLVPLKNRVPVSAKLGKNSATLGFIQENMTSSSARMYAFRIDTQGDMRM